MKKTTKKLIFLTLILMLSFCFSTRVEAKACNKYSYNECPTSEGKCFKYPYGNNNQGSCEEKKTCTSYNKHIITADGSNDVYMISDYAGDSVHYDLQRNQCVVRDDCFLDVSRPNRGNGYTYYSCYTKEVAKKCEDIENVQNVCERYKGNGCDFVGGACITVKKCSDASVKNCDSFPGCKVVRGKCTGSVKNIEYLAKATEKFKCSDVKHLTSIWMFLRIITPFIVVLFGSLDFFKAMAAGDEKEIKASRGKFVKRLIAFFLFILLPFVIQFIFERMGTNGSQKMCLIKCITTNDTSSKGCD